MADFFAQFAYAGTNKPRQQLSARPPAKQQQRRPAAAAQGQQQPASSCPACRGRKRAHTCGTRGKHAAAGPAYPKPPAAAACTAAQPEAKRARQGLGQLGAFAAAAVPEGGAHALPLAPAAQTCVRPLQPGGGATPISPPAAAAAAGGEAPLKAMQSFAKPGGTAEPAGGAAAPLKDGEFLHVQGTAELVRTGLGLEAGLGAAEVCAAARRQLGLRPGYGGDGLKGELAAICAAAGLQVSPRPQLPATSLR